MNDIPYFDLDFLVKRFMKMSPDDLSKNAAIKKKKKENGGELPGDASDF
jgi:hypothetical protein